MKAFISYSTNDKQYSKDVKTIFDDLGIESFLAHDDLQVSEEWKKRILSELKSSKIFIPLLSKAFLKSDWCSQETGAIANKMGVMIIPLSLDGTNPKGFISHIQGHLVRNKIIDKEVIYEAIGKKWPELIIDAHLRHMGKVYSYRQAEEVLEPIVPYFKHFTNEQSNKFAELSINNNQIWAASLCQKDYLPAFLKLNRSQTKQRLYRSLKNKIEK